MSCIPSGFLKQVHLNSPFLLCLELYNYQIIQKRAFVVEMKLKYHDLVLQQVMTVDPHSMLRFHLSYELLIVYCACEYLEGWLLSLQDRKTS